MPSFRNDYSYLAHPRVLEALKRYSEEEQVVYGLDKHSMNAASYIKKVFNSPNGEVFFLAGGTQTNMVFITSCLRHFEGVISCDTGHINVHESACIEGNGNKIITVKNKNGKLTPADIDNVMRLAHDEHMVKPKLVYISDSTELGTIYSKQELLDLRECTKKHDLYFFIDGARIGAALASLENDIKPSLIGEVCDAFYVGGTKNGCLFGEALVVNNKDLQKDFRRHIKNKGAMLAKGFSVGIQFEEMFKDGLYFELAKNTNLAAEELKHVLIQYYKKVSNSPTNQVFVTVNKETAKKLISKFSLELWEEFDDEMTVRFVTSFMTTLEDVEEVDKYLRSIQ